MFSYSIRRITSDYQPVYRIVWLRKMMVQRSDLAGCSFCLIRKVVLLIIWITIYLKNEVYHDGKQN